jgi:3'-phosphoadenosine 5'-phosphosulfate sulfotransferase (PAPS reductase)/FAD synthetase
MVTEGMALKYCYDKGFDWGGLYTHFDRASCWCCPLKNERELYMLYSFYPDLWEELKDMDQRSWNQFKTKYSVKQFEEKFKGYKIA